MNLSIDVTLEYDLMQATDLLLQIEAANGFGQTIVSEKTDVADTLHFARVEAQEAIGNRLWLRTDRRLSVRYAAEVEVTRKAADLSTLNAVPPHLLPGDTVRYLMPSRFCPADTFQNYVTSDFGDLVGGARIMAIRDWIAREVAYVSGSSDSSTTALETFVQRQGVCRDFAHLMVALARASAIPARFASVYAPGVNPPDFHAVAEVFLDGAWHLVDATGMASPEDIVIIGVGMDAAEVAFLTSYGAVMLVEQTVSVMQKDASTAAPAT